MLHDEKNNKLDAMAKDTFKYENAVCPRYLACLNKGLY